MLKEIDVQTVGPEAFTFRPARMEDLEAALVLFNACSVAQIGVADFEIDDIRTEWQTPKYDLGRSTQVALAPDGRLVGFVEVWDTSAVPVSPWVWGRVHPEYEGLGIGTHLMGWAEQRARQAIARVPVEARVAMRSGTISSYLPARRLFEKLGMTPVRYFWHMVADLDGPPPAPQWPEGIVVRTYQETQDLRTIFRATHEAFRDHWGHVDQPEEDGLAHWRHWLENDKTFDPSLWFLAMDGDEITAVSLCRSKAFDDEEMGWVNTLGVRRPWRRQGLALALLHYTFNEFYQRGRKRVGLGVDADSLTGATRLYEKAGMHVTRQFDNFEKELRPGRDLSTQSLEE